MKNLFYLLLLTLATTMTSCSKDDNVKEPKNQDVISTTIGFHLLNEQGEDLLDPNVKGYYDFEKMKLFYLRKGKKIEVFDPLMESPRNLAVISESEPNYLRVHLGAYDENYTSFENGVKKGIHIAYLKLSETDTDTIKSSWMSKPNIFAISKIWYNGVEYSINSLGGKPFTVTKK